MAFRIATNVSSLNTQRWLGVNQAQQSKALERLSSGYKINNASDDAAGIAIATKLNVKSVSLLKSIDNGNQGIAMLQAAEGGVDTLSNILTRLKELATQAASDNTTDRAALDTERSNLETEINNIAQATKYGNTQLLNSTAPAIGTYGGSLTVGNGISAIDVSGVSVTATTQASFSIDTTANVATLSFGGVTQSLTIAKPTGLATNQYNFSSLGVKITINANATSLTSSAAGTGFTMTAGVNNQFSYFMGDTNNSYNIVQVTMKNYSTTSTDVMYVDANGVGGGNISTASAAKLYLDDVNTAIGNLTTERGKIGAAQNQLNYHVANMTTMNENTQAATSTIKDADFASEMATFTKSQILTQSGISMLSQSNQMNQAILSLLK